MSSLGASGEGPGAEGQVLVGASRLSESSLLLRSVGHHNPDDHEDNREQTADESEVDLSLDRASKSSEEVLEAAVANLNAI